MADHKSLPEVDLHESKGVSTALASTVYVANGTGSGTWRKLTLAEVQSSGSAGQLIESDGAGGFVTKQRLYRYDVNTGTLPAVPASTTTEVTINVTGLVAATDDVVQIVKPSHQAGLLLANARIANNNQLILQFGNLTAASITPTASEVYTLLVWRRG